MTRKLFGGSFLTVLVLAGGSALQAQRSRSSHSIYTLKDDSKTGCVTTPNPRGSSPKQVSGGVLNNKALELPHPVGGNPTGKGNVAVQVLVGEDGAVVAAAGVSGDKRYHPAAIDAARKAKFEPTLLNGFPVKVTGVIFYKF